MKRAIIVITAEQRETANQLCGEIVVGGENTFRVPLSADGESITHYFCNWQMTEEEYTAINAEFEHVYDVPPHNSGSVLAGLGLQEMGE